MDILNKRWKEVDKKLTDFYISNNKLNKEMIDNIQQILDTINVKYDKLFSYVDKKYQRILRTKVNELKQEVEIDGYVGYLLNEYVTKSKLRYNEYLLALFIIEYYKRDLKRKNIEFDLLKQVSVIVYEDGQQEAIEVLDKKKPRLLTVPEAYLLQLIGMSKYNNAFWSDYKQGSISYNAEQLFKLVALNVQMGKELNVDNDDFKKLFEKQERNYLAKKKNETIEGKTGYVDIYYGAVDDLLVAIANQMALKGMIDQGCKKVQFIATVDEKTTEMCMSLNSQVFSINGINKYYRYSAIDDKEVLYTTKGLVLGENLPPITNHFHYCRSTIYPVRDVN